MFDLKLQQLQDEIIEKINESQIPITVAVLMLQEILRSAQITKEATLKEQRDQAVSEMEGNKEGN